MRPDPRPPPPVTISEPRRMPLPAVIILTGMALVGLGLLGRMWWVLIDPPRTASVEISPQNVAQDYSVTAVPSTWPPELLMMAVAIGTSLAPTPEPTPTPIYVMSTVPPTVQCGAWVQYGTLCEWGAAAYTPTPIPASCQTPVPKTSCVWRGATPTVVSGFEGMR